MITLTGITWNNTRGYLPKVATAQRFSEMHPEIQVEWRKRPLEEFAHYPVDQLARQYDFIDLDHPSIGHAVAQESVLALEDVLPADFLEDQASNSVGLSHESYRDGDRHWALAIDAATPVSSCRRELLDARRLRIPETWEQLLELARTGAVIMPAVPVDCMMAHYMLCIALGEEPFQNENKVSSADTGHAALRMLKELVTACPPLCLGCNPIQIYQILSSSDQYVYCPFGFGYGHFSRDGYADHPLHFGGLVSYKGRRLRSTLGGTGLAISSHTKHPREAALYAQYAASPACQRTIYFQSGGQPGHRAAWTDPEVNRVSRDYFRNTLQTLDEAYLRPRYNGYIEFQEQGGVAVHDHMTGRLDASATLARLDALYRETRRR